jgi:Fe-S cluster assembly protein SufD
VTTALPTRRDEAWRYADLEAVKAVWPVPAPEVLVVPAGATRALVIDAAAAPGGIAIRQLAVSVGESAVFVVHVVNAGGRYGRVALDVTLAARSRFDLGGVLIGSEEQTLEIVTTVTHAGPGATSRQSVRAVAGAGATVSFLGKVAVTRDGQKTDAEQSFKALLLDRSGVANAKPELEIFADDVKCAHGATVGELDPQALFYLGSRGVPPAEARALLTRAFLSDALEGLGEAEREALDKRLDALMAALA